MKKKVEPIYPLGAKVRIIAESAWELWEDYNQKAPRTSAALRQWWDAPSTSGKAVLLLDALSLRELPNLMAGAKAHGIAPLRTSVTGAEVPSDTDHFAKALGVPSRSSLSNNSAPGTFLMGSGGTFTDVMSYAFEDCLGSIPNEQNLFLWHTWPDRLIHEPQMTHSQLANQIARGLSSKGLWQLVDRLRQGRRLVITSDHGYGTAQLFSSEEREKDAVAALRGTFGAQRYRAATEPWAYSFMPPLVTQANGYLVVMGQRKWVVQGGFPHLCHGGLSLLEVAVPFVEFSAK